MVVLHFEGKADIVEACNSRVVQSEGNNIAEVQVGTQSQTNGTAAGTQSQLWRQSYLHFVKISIVSYEG